MGSRKNNFPAFDYFYFYSPNPYIIVQSALACTHPYGISVCARVPEDCRIAKLRVGMAT